MIDNEKEKALDVKFTFDTEGKSDIEIKKEIEELLRKRDMLLASRGLSIPSDSNNNNNKNNITNDSPRQIK